MPPARSSGSGSTSRSKSTSAAKRTSGAKSSSGAKRTSAAKTSSAKRSTASASSSRAKSTRSSGSRSTGSATASRSTAKKSSASGAEARVDAAAERLRKLNERIITAGKDAGESTLSTYETALKAIASAIEKGPGSSEVDWISHVATAQAKFIRDVTTAWTKAARSRLK